MKAQVNDITIQIVLGDILQLAIAALVNDSDEKLSLPPKLAEKAGPEVAAECAKLGFCAVGSAVMTGGGKSGYQKIIHTVGPRWGEGSERGKLLGTVLETLRLAESNGLKSLALPPISTGAAGYPLENCATTLLTQVIDFTFEDLHHLREVYICLETHVALGIFEAEFRQQLDELLKAGEGKIQV